MDKTSKRRSAMNLAGVVLLIFAAVFIALYVVSTSPEIQQWYAKYEEILYKIDMAIVSIGYTHIITIIIFAIYLIKCFFPILSMPAVCILTGMVFPATTALIVNAAGLFIMFTVKYNFGLKHGGGKAQRVLYKNQVSRILVEYSGKGNPWLLFILRFIPSFPINAVSQLYGSLKFNYKKYIIISMASFMPKLFTYTFIGVSIFDPLSFGFFLPLILLFAVSGVSVLALNALLNHLEKV